MSTIFKRLAEVHVPSFESAIAETDTDIEQHSVDEAINEISSLHDEMADHSKASGALETLVEGTLDTYKETGMDEQAAELYRVSVESVLAMAGIKIPVDLMVPSFESGMSRSEYSKEVEEKSKNILKRIWEWIVNAFKRFGELLVKLKNKLLGRKKALDDKADAVKEKAAKSGDVPKRMISLSDKEQQLLASVGYALEQETVMDFEKEIIEAWKSANRITSQSISIAVVDKASAEKANREIAAAIKGMANLKLGKAHVLKITAGSNDTLPAIGSKVVVDFTGTKKPEIESISSSDAELLADWVKNTGNIIPDGINKLNELIERGKSLYDEHTVDLYVKDDVEFIRQYARHVTAGMTLEIATGTQLQGLVVDFLQTVLSVAERSLMGDAKEEPKTE